MKLKYNWLIHLRYILEPPLNLFKAHIELQMFSYENKKAIKLIDLFVGFAPLYKAPGVLSGLQIQVPQAPSLRLAVDRTEETSLDIWSNTEQMVRREAWAFEIQS